VRAELAEHGPVGIDSEELGPEEVLEALTRERP
jgi:hypothetical protein